MTKALTQPKRPMLWVGSLEIGGVLLILISRRKPKSKKEENS